MGGLLILFAAVVPSLVVSLYTIPGLTVMLATLACALIGFADDFLKVGAGARSGSPAAGRCSGSRS